MINYADFVGPLATALGACVGAYFSGRLGMRNAEAASRTTRRHEHADHAIEALRELRKAFHESDSSWTVSGWEPLLERAFDALRALEPVLPYRLSHLRRSTRAAAGEALGAIAVAELVSVREKMPLAEFDQVWAENARDYLDVVVGALRAWREATERSAPRASVRTFDEWLRVTGRYVPFGT